MCTKKLELGQFIHWDWGQNYPFGACMAKLMECLGGDTTLFTYDFFAGLAGDDFVMCYGNNENFNDCVSVCTDSASFLARISGMIGLEYQLVTHSVWTKTPKPYFDLLKQSIDRGIPVLSAGTLENRNYDLIISYDDTTMKCHISCGDDVQYGEDIPFPELKCDLIFINQLPIISSLADVYRQAVMQIPALMTAKPTKDGVYFGAEAYQKWAEDTVNGRYDSYTAETFDAWKHWHIYICNLATNARHGTNFLHQAQEQNPDMTFIPELLSLLDENTAVWNELEALGGGFNCTIDTLHDHKKAENIANTILKLKNSNEKIIHLIR